MQEPNWLKIARKYTGVRETPGLASAPIIIGWAKRLGVKVLGAAYNDDATPWCGLFCAEVMTEAGLKPPAIAVRASSWDDFGIAVEKPYLGAIARFQRPGGGHVAIITGQSPDGKLLRVLGGNQHDRVCEAWIKRSRCMAMRWPDRTARPLTIAPTAEPGIVSKDEA